MSVCYNYKGNSFGLSLISEPDMNYLKLFSYGPPSLAHGKVADFCTDHITLRPVLLVREGGLEHNE